MVGLGLGMGLSRGRKARTQETKLLTASGSWTDAAELNALDALFVGLRPYYHPTASGLFLPIAGDGLTESLRGIATTAGSPAVALGTGTDMTGSDYARNDGWTFNGTTQYIDYLTFLLSSLADHDHSGALAVNQAANLNTIICGGDGGGTLYAQSFRWRTDVGAELAAVVEGLRTVFATTVAGTFMPSERRIKYSARSATQCEIYRESTSVADITTADRTATGGGTATMRVGGMGASRFPGKVRFLAVGLKALSDAEQATVDGVISDYLTAQGRPVA